MGADQSETRNVEKFMRLAARRLGRAASTEHFNPWSSAQNS